MNRRFYWEITAFLEKHAFNVHFFILNIHFRISHIHFFFIQKSTSFYFSFIFPSIRIISFWVCALVTFA